MFRLIKNFTVLFTGKPHASKKIRLNETINLILNRRSCRSFSNEEISRDDLRVIIEAGRFAPSTVNLQTWSFITFTKSEWNEVFENPIPFKAFFAIVICADTYRLKDYLSDLKQTNFVNLSFALFNAGLAAMNMTIAAEALGIKSIMLSETGKTGLLDLAYLKEKLCLPDGVLPVTTLVLGKSNTKTAGIPPRQPADSVVMAKTYNQSNGSNLKDWFQQMFIGFKLTHPLISFDKQIDFYKKKMLITEPLLEKQFLLGKRGSAEINKYDKI
jgi:nitroreductase